MAVSQFPAFPVYMRVGSGEEYQVGEVTVGVGEPADFRVFAESLSQTLREAADEVIRLSHEDKREREG